jgi:hypothetical protein
MDQFDGYDALEVWVCSFVYSRHATLPEQGIDFVSSA